MTIFLSKRKSHFFFNNFKVDKNLAGSRKILLIFFARNLFNSSSNPSFALAIPLSKEYVQPFSFKMQSVFQWKKKSWMRLIKEVSWLKNSYYTTITKIPHYSPNISSRLTHNSLEKVNIDPITLQTLQEDLSIFISFKKINKRYRFSVVTWPKIGTYNIGKLVGLVTLFLSGLRSIFIKNPNFWDHSASICLWISSTPPIFSLEYFQCLSKEVKLRNKNFEKELIFSRGFLWDIFSR